MNRPAEKLTKADWKVFFKRAKYVRKALGTVGDHRWQKNQSDARKCSSCSTRPVRVVASASARPSRAAWGASNMPRGATLRASGRRQEQGG